MTRNGDFFVDEVSRIDSAKSPSSINARVPSASIAVIADPIPLVSVICNESVAVRTPCSGAVASPEYVPLTVPTLPSEAASAIVNEPLTSGNVLTARLGVSEAAAWLIAERSLGACSIADGADSGPVPAQAAEVKTREITTVRRTIGKRRGSQAFTIAAPKQLPGLRASRCDEAKPESLPCYLVRFPGNNLSGADSISRCSDDDTRRDGTNSGRQVT